MWSTAWASDDDPVLQEIQVPISRSFRDLEEKGRIRRLDHHRIQMDNLVALRQLAGIWDFASPRRLPNPA